VSSQAQMSWNGIRASYYPVGRHQGAGGWGCYSIWGGEGAGWTTFFFVLSNLMIWSRTQVANRLCPLFCCRPCLEVNGNMTLGCYELRIGSPWGWWETDCSAKQIRLNEKALLQYLRPQVAFQWRSKLLFIVMPPKTSWRLGQGHHLWRCWVFIASVKEPFCRKLTKYPRCAGGVKSVMVIVTLALRLFLRTSLYSWLCWLDV
jgi:hypothetical protein